MCRYSNIRIGKPSVMVDFEVEDDIAPQECRLRDMTYAAPIIGERNARGCGNFNVGGSAVDVEYTRGREIVKGKKLTIGRMPIMLRSSHCVLKDKSHEELYRLGECPLDPGFFFVPFRVAVC